MAIDASSLHMGSLLLPGLGEAGFIVRSHATVAATRRRLPANLVVVHRLLAGAGADLDLQGLGQIPQRPNGSCVVTVHDVAAAEDEDAVARELAGQPEKRGVDLRLARRIEVEQDL